MGKHTKPLVKGRTFLRLQGVSSGNSEHAIVWSTVALFIGSVGLVAGQMPIEGRSFSLWSRVKTFSTESDQSDMYFSHLHEVYSIEQQRGRVDFKLKTRDWMGENVQEKDRSRLVDGSFYLDQELSLAVMVNNLQRGCNESSLDELNRLIYWGNPLPSERVAPSYVVGPAQLLFLVAKYRGRMRRLFEDQKKVRGLSGFMFELQLAVGPSDKIVFWVAYSEPIITGSSIPIEIIMNYGNYHVVTIDYSQIELIQANSVLETSRRLIDDAVAFDSLALPARFGCAGLLVNKVPEDLFANKSSSSTTTRFFFKATVEYENEEDSPLEAMVAFDTRLESLLVDWTPTMLAAGQERRSGTRQQLFNFKLNRVYHVTERVEGSWNSELDSLVDGSAGAGRKQCLLARIQPKQDSADYTRPYTIGQLLVGADKFVYLGRAWVRGIEALVYEARGGALPFWLDQPVIYGLPKGGEARFRHPLNIWIKYSTLNTVLYFAEQDDNHPLLLIETAYTRDGAGFYGRRTIHVHDFVWELGQPQSSSSVVGEQPLQELFSLEDVCSVGAASSTQTNDEGDNRYAKVKMLLESEKVATELPRNGPLASASHRNLALVASLQENLRLPAAMIYDLESRLIQRSRGAARGLAGATLGVGSQVISVSFRVAEHPTNLVEAIYLGMGYERSATFDAGRRRVRANVRSFNECFFLAAHRRHSVFFAFEMQSRLCIIDVDTVPHPTALDDAPAIFMVDNIQPFQVFRTQHIVESELSRENHWIERTSRSSGMLKFLGAELNLKGLDLSDSLRFRIRELQVDETDLKSSFGGGGGAAGSQPATDRQMDRLIGVGLMESEPGNKRIAPVPFDSELATTSVSPDSTSQSDSKIDVAMTFEQCQAACLSDLECRSFSVCVRRSQVECVISKTSLKLSAEFVEKLEKLGSKQPVKLIGKTKNDKRINATNEEGRPVELALHPNCQLYSRNILGLFDRRPRESIALSQRQIRPVQSRFECAEMCLKQNMDFLRSDREAAIELSAALTSPSPAKWTAHDMVQERMTNMGARCNLFYYLAKSRLHGSSKLEKKLYSRATESWNSSSSSAILAMDQVEGYCMLGATSSIDGRSGYIDGRSSYFDFERYTFKPELFYQKQQGLRLLKSPLVDQIGQRGERGHQESDYSQLGLIIGQGENNQVGNYRLTASDCAKLCFFYGWGAPWPSCRSFDVVVVDVKGGSSRITCHLNTLTLRQAISSNRTDLIERVGPDSRTSSSDGAHVSVWHYDPRPGFALDDRPISGGKLPRLTMTAGRKRRQDGHLANTLGSFLVVLLALVSGAFAGIRLGQTLIGRARPIRTPQDMHMIIESITGPEVGAGSVDSGDQVESFQ